MLRNKGLLLLLGMFVLSQPAAIAFAAVVPSVEVQDIPQISTKPKKIQLFGSSELRSRGSKSFNKWTTMWRRHNLPRSSDEQVTKKIVEPPQGCRGKDRITCGRNKWNKFVEEQQGMPLGELLGAVNHYMNRSTYIVDPVNWGIPDYWATPDEFFLKDGDCEDYAISKYVTLKRLGVDPSIMRLVILQDENLRVAHAVLAVRYEDKYMILDNQVNAVLPDTKILHYRPVYSINESGWWLHHKRRFSIR